jgi:hypothetical protein
MLFTVFISLSILYPCNLIPNTRSPPVSRVYISPALLLVEEGILRALASVCPFSLFCLESSPLNTVEPLSTSLPSPSGILVSARLRLPFLPLDDIFALVAIAIATPGHEIDFVGIN